MKTISLILLSLALFAMLSRAQEMNNQYLVLHSLYVFEYRDELPYEVIRPMLWDSGLGFSEISETPDYLYTVVSSDLIVTYVLQDATSGDCFALEMQTDDPMLEPHVAQHEWVTCPE